MKGTLHKIDSVWSVKFFDHEEARDVMYCGETVPLHPDDQIYCLPSDEGKEVNFKKVLADCNSTDKVNWVAELNAPADYSETTKIESIARTEYRKIHGGDSYGAFPDASDEDVWIDGFVQGFMKK